MVAFCASALRGLAILAAVSGLQLQQSMPLALIIEPTALAQSPQQRAAWLSDRSALVLNADYQPLSYLPLSVWSWQHALKSAWEGRVDVLATYSGGAVRSARQSFELPAVVVLRTYERPPKNVPRFSKRMLLVRDGFQCQYCQKSFAPADLTCDHVVPRSRGGNTDWENTVAACRPCNHRKGDLSLQQCKKLGMGLLKAPQQPTAFQ
mmetsp:Transcript_15913/g.56569  ORF Transcript_15913/g.56569 Transcript_15913/m.56569 type:complete len:207 (+) Transcript_15913:192-812(+)